MTDTLFDVYFSGKVLEGQEMEAVRHAVADIFKADSAMVERLFSGTPVRIKAGVDQETAIKYRVTFRQAGAIVDIKPTDSAPEPTEQTTTEKPQATDSMTLLPAKSGSLIDCAIEEEAAPIGDFSYMSLAPEGTDIDETEPTPELDIDTSNLEIKPDNE